MPVDIIDFAWVSGFWGLTGFSLPWVSMGFVGGKCAVVSGGLLVSWGQATAGLGEGVGREAGFSLRRS
jgi:hypothetical protein